MNRALIILPLALAAAIAGSAQAQVAPPDSPAVAAVDLHRYQADQHRYEIDRLRARADKRETFARQLQFETRLNRLEIEAVRLPEPIQSPAWRPLRLPEEERALRESATDRRRATTAGVTQIDAWLDRPAH